MMIDCYISSLYFNYPRKKLPTPLLDAEENIPTVPLPSFFRMIHREAKLSHASPISHITPYRAAGDVQAAQNVIKESNHV